MKQTAALVMSLAIVTAIGGCNGQPAAPDVVRTVDFTGTWIGVSRVISCEPSAAACANYPVGHTRYLNFRLTQSGDAVTGNLSPTSGGPTALPAVFWISGGIASGRLTFQPMEVAGASGGLTSYSGEVTVIASVQKEMIGRMTERSSFFGEPYTIAWDVRTTRR